MVETETTARKNWPLLRETLAYIEAHPEEWDQGVWARKAPELSCGTACCFAGTAVRLAEPDARFAFDDGVCTSRLGDGRGVPETAQDALGLTGDEAHELFDGANSLDDIRELLYEWAQEDGKEL